MATDREVNDFPVFNNSYGHAGNLPFGNQLFNKIRKTIEWICLAALLSEGGH
jgi:hypothetical protein